MDLGEPLRDRFDALLAEAGVEVGRQGEALGRVRRQLCIVEGAPRTQKLQVGINKIVVKPLPRSIRLERRNEGE